MRMKDQAVYPVLIALQQLYRVCLPMKLRKRNEVKDMRQTVKRSIAFFAVLLAFFAMLNLGSVPVFAEDQPLYISVKGNNALADAQPKCTVRFVKGEDIGPEPFELVINADSYNEEGLFLSQNLMPEIKNNLKLDTIAYGGNKAVLAVTLASSDADETSQARYVVTFKIEDTGLKIDSIMRTNGDDGSSEFGFKIDTSSDLNANTFRFTNTYKEQPPAPPTPTPAPECYFTKDIQVNGQKMTDQFTFMYDFAPKTTNAPTLGTETISYEKTDNGLKLSRELVAWIEDLVKDKATDVSGTHTYEVTEKANILKGSNFVKGSDYFMMSQAKYEVTITLNQKKVTDLKVKKILNDDGTAADETADINAANDAQANTFRFTNTYKEQPPAPPTPTPVSEYYFTKDIQVNGQKMTDDFVFLFDFVPQTSNAPFQGTETLPYYSTDDGPKLSREMVSWIEGLVKVKPTDVSGTYIYEVTENATILKGTDSVKGSEYFVMSQAKYEVTITFNQKKVTDLKVKKVLNDDGTKVDPTTDVNTSKDAQANTFRFTNTLKGVTPTPDTPPTPATPSAPVTPPAPPVTELTTGNSTGLSSNTQQQMGNASGQQAQSSALAPAPGTVNQNLAQNLPATGEKAPVTPLALLTSAAGLGILIALRKKLGR